MAGLTLRWSSFSKICEQQLCRNSFVASEFFSCAKALVYHCMCKHCITIYEVRLCVHIATTSLNSCTALEFPSPLVISAIDAFILVSPIDFAMAVINWVQCMNHCSTFYTTLCKTRCLWISFEIILLLLLSLATHSGTCVTMMMDHYFHPNLNL